MVKKLILLIILIPLTYVWPQRSTLDIILDNGATNSFLIQNIKNLTFSESANNESVSKLHDIKNDNWLQSYNLNLELTNGTMNSYPVLDIKELTFSIRNDVGATKKFQNILETFTLLQNYPNPFNPSTIIQYSLPKRGNVEIQIFNVNGQLIKKLNSGFREAGVYKETWDSKNDNGEHVTSGLYLYQVKFENSILSRKMTFIK